MNISWREGCGSLLIGGFEGRDLPKAFGDQLAGGEVGGAILFKRNIESLEQVFELNQAIGGACPGSAMRPFVSLDQEGGPVQRLRGLTTDLPPMRDLGRHGDPKLAERVGRALGRELRTLGFNLNFAPVLDVDSNPDNPVIGKRSFSSDPDVVSKMGLGFARGLMLAGVVPCAKHFPGHGDTRTDSHKELPKLAHDFERLWETELVPFRAAIEQSLPLIMTAHILLESIDAVYPATLSRIILTDILRDRLGFKGVIISDDLEMAAIEQRYEIEEIVELGLRAGIDVFLICHSHDKQRAGFEALVRLGERKGWARQRIQESASRIAQLKRDYLVKSIPNESNWQAVIRCEEHLALAAEIGS